METDYNKLLGELNDSIDSWEKNKIYVKENIEQIKKQAKNKRYVAVFNGKTVGFSDSEPELIESVKGRYNLSQTFFKDLSGADGYSISSEVDVGSIINSIKVKEDKEQDLAGSFFDKPEKQPIK